MPKPRALTALQAKRTLANRLGTRLGDNLRQLNTKFGIRPYRLFLVWTKWTGIERGEGDEQVVAEHEILPTPKVESLDSVALSIFAAGQLEVGSVRVSEVSLKLTRDQLTGRDIPGVGIVDHVEQPYDFFYEMREDGRGEVDTGVQPARLKFRLAADPFRRAEKPYWQMTLERISEDRSRLGKSNVGNDSKLLGP
jgi:hypothetical protein